MNTSSNREQKPASKVTDEAAPARQTDSFRSPEVVRLGEAHELMQRDGSGHLVDGTGGWWVWGS